MSKKLLVVCPFSCYPPTHGGKLDIYNSLLQLRDAHLDICVDLLYCDYIQPERFLDDYLQKEVGVNEVYFLKIQKNKLLSLLYLFHYKPNYCMLYRCLVKFKPKQRYDYVLIHGFHADSILENPNLDKSRFLYRMHNYEYIYSMQKVPFEKNFLMKLLRVYDTLKIKFREKWLLNKVKKVLCISSEEYNYFSKLYGEKIYFLPTYIDTNKFINYERQNNSKNVVLFIGNLFTSYNKEALLWYLKNVHNHIGNFIPNYRLIIAGSTGGADVRWLEAVVGNDKKITTHFDVVDMAPFYKQAKVFVNPMLNGAGVKLKTLDAIVNGMPVVSTTTGISGTGLSHQVHCLIANSADEFSNAIALLLQNANMAKLLVQNGQNYLKDKFCNQVILNMIYD